MVNDELRTGLPAFCEGVEVHPDKPYMSLTDGIAKALVAGAGRADRGDFESMIPYRNLVDASLYWLQRSEKFYHNKPDTLQELASVKSILEELREQVVQGRHEEFRGTVEKLRAAKESLGKIFQVEAATLTNQTAMPLIRLAFGGKLNRKMIDILQAPMAGEKIASLIKVVADYEAQAIDEDSLTKQVEALFTEELK